MRLILTTALLISSTALWAKHTSVNLTLKGLNKVISEVVSSTKDQRGGDFRFEGKPIFDRITAESFNQNKLIKSIDNFVPLNQKEDFVFMVDWSPIKFDGDIKKGSLKVFTEGTKSNFDISLKLSLENFKLSGNYIEICELKKWKCNRGKQLFGRIKNYSVRLSGNQNLDIAAILNVQIKNGKVQLKFKKMYSSLIAPKSSSARAMYNKLGIKTRGTNLDINFSDFILPPLSISIDGEELATDITKLKDTILGHKQYLGKQLALFAGDFLGKDLVKMVNKDFLSQMDNVASKYSILDYDSELRDIKAQLSSLVRSGKQSDGQLVFGDEDSVMGKIKSVVKAVISSAKFDMSLTGVSSKNGDNFNVDFDSTLSLNSKKWNLSTKLRNGKGTLKQLDLSGIKNKNYDFAVAISEPLVNGALGAINDTKIIQSIVKDVVGMKGVYVKKAHIHFEPEKNYTLSSPSSNPRRGYKEYTETAKDNVRVKMRDFRPIGNKVSYTKPKLKLRRGERISFTSKSKVVVVAEVKVNLRELETKTWGESITNQIGALLEGGDIWFPLEISFTPILTEKGEQTFIQFSSSTPIRGKQLVNTYGYPYKNMKGIVESGLLDTLKKDLLPQLSSLPTIDLTPYLNVSGLELDPKEIHVSKSGHLVITSNFKKIDISELGSKK